MCCYMAFPQMVEMDNKGFYKIMAWANPDNINTANLDSNTDSPSLARADIKTAFDEIRNVANNSKIAWTPVVNLSAGTFTISYNTPSANYIQMGDILFFELHLDFNALVSDSTAFEAGLEITGFPTNPSSTIAPVHIDVQTETNFQSTPRPNTLRIQATGNKAFVHGGSEEAQLTGANLSSGVTVNNIVLKAKGFYFV